jgi:hypothetical protein
LVSVSFIVGMRGSLNRLMLQMAAGFPTACLRANIHWHSGLQSMAAVRQNPRPNYCKICKPDHRYASE